MTAQCNGAPSQIKPLGQAALQVLGPDSIAELVGGAGMAWFQTVAYGVGYLTYDLGQLCVTDPPALPTIDAARLAGYFNPLNPQGAFQLREDAQAIVGYALWFLYCECSDLSTPIPPKPLQQPTGVDVNNPGLQGFVANPCGVGGQDQSNVLFDSTGHGTYTQLLTRLPPSNVLWYQINFLTATATPGTPTTYPINVSMDEIGASSQVLRTQQFVLTPAPSGNGLTFSFTYTPGTQGWVLHMTQPQYAGQYVGTTGTYQWLCTPIPPTLLPDCCPPDPGLLALLNQVLQLEQEILAGLPGPKKPYVDSTVHAGLTGTGAVRIDPAAVAIRIDITSRPDAPTPNPYQPPYLLSLGFITPFAVGTPLRGSRLVYDHQIYQYPSYTDQIGYGLEDGITISIVELRNGP